MSARQIYDERGGRCDEAVYANRVRGGLQAAGQRLRRHSVAAVTPGPEIADKPTAGRDATAEKLSRTTVYVDVKC